MNETISPMLLADAIRQHNWLTRQRATMQRFLRRTPAGHPRVAFVTRIIALKSASIAAVDRELDAARLGK